MGDANAAGDSFTFSAFISYARKDRADAVSLQRRLEQYRLDADLRVKEGDRFFPARPLQPVFRDEDELVPGQDLPERIRKGLTASRYLIVLASTASVQSRWVEKEILDFMALGKPDRIIILVMDGEPNAAKNGKKPDLECLPRPFRVKFTADGQATDQAVPEPNWVDWRGRRKNDRINFLRLVSALLQLDRFDDLLRRDARSERRRLRLFQAATSVFVALGLAAAGGAVLAAQQLNEVRTTESRFLARLAGDLAEPNGDAAKGDHLRALQIAIGGAPTANWAIYPRPLTLETEVALRRSVSHIRLTHFMQHTYAVHAAAISPDGRRIATVSRSEVPWANFSVVTLWDGQSGALVHAPTNVADGAFADNFAISFSPDGERVLAAAGTAAHLFDAATGERIGQPLTVAKRSEELTRVRFSADGLRVLTDDGLWDGRTSVRIRPISTSVWVDESLKRIVTLPAKDTTQLIDGVNGAAIGAPVKHGGNVISISFAGNRMAIAAEDNTVSLWDATMGAPTGIVVSTSAVPEAIYLNADGTRLLTIAGAWEGPREAQLWDTRTGRPVGNAITSSEALAARFSPDGTRLALTSSEGTSTNGQLLDTATGKQLSLLDHGWVRFSPDGRFLLIMDTGGQAQLWDARRNIRIGNSIVQSGEIITNVAFSPDSTRFLLGSPSGVGLWDTTGRFVDELKHDDPMAKAAFSTISHVSTLSASFSADGLSILTASSDASARLWNAQADQILPKKLIHPAPIRTFAVSPDGKTLATAGEDRSVRLWNARSGTSIGAVMMHEGIIDSLEFSPDGARLLTNAGGDARLWDARTGASVGAILRHEGISTEAVFSSDGTRVATASDDDTAKLWDARTGAQIGAVMQHANDARGVMFSPDRTRLLTISGADEDTSPDGASGAPTGEARLWNATTGAPLGRVMAHARLVTQATFSSDGARIATASLDETARVWDGHTGAPLLTLKHHEKVTRVSFSPDGSRILTVSFGELDASGAAHLWSATGKPIADMLQGNPTSARFSPDGSRIATIGFGPSEAYLFDSATGKPIAFVTHKRDSMVWAYMFSSDGTLLATSGGKEVRLWDARTGASIGSPLTGEIPASAVVFSPDTSDLLTMNGSDLYRWNVAAWSRTGAPLIAQACEVLTSTRAGPLPPELNARAFRSPQASRPCEQRGLLDWRFYADALSGDR